MTKYLFKCLTCNTIMSIETELPDDKIHKVPPCPCGKSRMISMNSREYAYGIKSNEENIVKDDLYKYGLPTGLWD